MLLSTVRVAISVSIPANAFPVMVSILTASVNAFEVGQQPQEDGEAFHSLHCHLLLLYLLMVVDITWLSHADEEGMVADAKSGQFWNTFQSLVERLHLLQVVETFFGHPAVVVVSNKASRAHLTSLHFNEQPSIHCDGLCKHL